MNPVDESTPSASWSTPLAAGIALIGAGIALAVAAAASYTEPPAMVFIGVAAVGLIVTGAIALVRRPRLSLFPGPRIVVRTLTGRVTLTTGDVVRIGTLETRRLAGRSRQLVIDLPDDRLLVFGRWDLGVEPSVVVEALTDAGFPGD
ncbi:MULTISPECIES: PH domain-containing protein [Gordonia]|jgi:hypothetical protein|uniref:PH domain-containing protein n=2 Tax=Bacillati TaxID=1783272 RepID=UPI0030187537